MKILTKVTKSLLLTAKDVCNQGNGYSAHILGMEFIGEMMFPGSVKKGPLGLKAGSQGAAINYSAPRW